MLPIDILFCSMSRLHWIGACIPIDSWYDTRGEYLNDMISQHAMTVYLNMRYTEYACIIIA